jgi:hypothetical protein
MTCGATHHAGFGARVTARALRRGALAAAVAFAMLAPPAVDAQIPRLPQRRSTQPAWWFTGGGAAVQLGDIADGRSGTRWRFGSDPLWQVRGGIEKSLQEGSAIGISVGYGTVDLTAIPLEQVGVVQPIPGECASSCQARMDLWSAMATFRAGNARRGFGSSLEGGLGFTGFSNLRTRDENQEFAGFVRSWDFTAALGGGFSYGFSDDFHVTLVQDFGIGFHSKKELPDGSSSTFRPRTTRFGLRYGFGSLR